MPIISINPFTNQTIATYQEDAKKTIVEKLDQTSAAQIKWKNLPIEKRAKFFLLLKQLLEKNKKELATLITTEMGKPITQSYLEIDKCAMVCEYYAFHSTEFLSIITMKSNAKESFTYFAPLGNVLAIMPWNFPFWQVFRSMVPIMMGGNGYVLKHASNVYGCANAIANLMKAAKFPKHIFQLLQITSNDIAFVIGNKNIHAVTLTGSTEAGRAVAVEAGKHIKKCVLELGGNDAYVILDDADVKQAVKAALYSRMINNGQSCIAAKRFIVNQKIAKQFEKELQLQVSNLHIGNPMDENCQIGPMARLDLRNELQKQVNQSIKKGAKCFTSSTITNSGAFFLPMILSNVKKGMTAYHDELFGPVCTIIVAKNNAEAISIANDTIYGLGAAVFTKDIEKGKKIAIHQLEAGNCFVNDFVRSVSGLAFGGVKQSGYGRELGKWGLYEFLNIKTVYIA
jgi:succinate-semialdehyde dehydrogenase / glutarate-semialdehyde dehydrogenase